MAGIHFQPRRRSTSRPASVNEYLPGLHGLPSRSNTSTRSHAMPTPRRASSRTRFGLFEHPAIRSSSSRMHDPFQSASRARRWRGVSLGIELASALFGALGAGLLASGVFIYATPNSARISAVDQASLPLMRIGRIGPDSSHAQMRMVCGLRLQ